MTKVISCMLLKPLIVVAGYLVFATLEGADASSEEIHGKMPEQSQLQYGIEPVSYTYSLLKNRAGASEEQFVGWPWKYASADVVEDYHFQKGGYVYILQNDTRTRSYNVYRKSDGRMMLYSVKGLTPATEHTTHWEELLEFCRLCRFSTPMCLTKEEEWRPVVEQIGQNEYIVSLTPPMEFPGRRYERSADIRTVRAYMKNGKALTVDSNSASNTVEFELATDLLENPALTLADRKRETIALFRELYPVVYEQAMPTRLTENEENAYKAKREELTRRIFPLRGAGRHEWPTDKKLRREAESYIPRWNRYKLTDAEFKEILHKLSLPEDNAGRRNVNEGVRADNVVSLLQRKRPNIELIQMRGGKVSSWSQLQDGETEIHLCIGHFETPQEAAVFMLGSRLCRAEIDDSPNAFSYDPVFRHYSAEKIGSHINEAWTLAAKSLIYNPGLVGDIDLCSKTMLDNEGVPVPSSEHSAIYFMRGCTAVAIYTENPHYNVLPLARIIDTLLADGLRKANTSLLREQQHVKRKH